MHNLSLYPFDRIPSPQIKINELEVTFVIYHNIPLPNIAVVVATVTNLI